MTDFMPREVSALPDLWEEILKSHWTYLETEESLQKLKERKKLEGYLKDFLCMVRHDRKFFLPETLLVLKNSIYNLGVDFKVNSAIAAFDAISQYANNLFTKPWRKEFRVLKLYSGFYQHEVKNSLCNAEKLFEAMGYRYVSDNILILDGPICPDQVTNVSRDAMAAYVELQIIKHIYNGLETLGLPITWLHIQRFREKHICGISQSIKSLSYNIHEKRFRESQEVSHDNYGYTDLQQPINSIQERDYDMLVEKRCHCNPYQCYMPSPVMNDIGLDNRRINDGIFHCNHIESPFIQSRAIPYNNFVNLSHQQHQHIYEKSITHHNNPPDFISQNYLQHHSNPHQHLRHLHAYKEMNRSQILQHSVDHEEDIVNPIYNQHRYQRYYNNYCEPLYDCIDGVQSIVGSSISYATVAQPPTHIVPTNVCHVTRHGTATNNSIVTTYTYNVAGSRYPLPINVGNQMSMMSSTQSLTDHQCTQYDSNYTTCNSHIIGKENQQLYAAVTKSPLLNYKMPAVTRYTPIISSSVAVNKNVISSSNEISKDANNGHEYDYGNECTLNHFNSSDRRYKTSLVGCMSNDSQFGISSMINSRDLYIHNNGQDIRNSNTTISSNHKNNDSMKNKSTVLLNKQNANNSQSLANNTCVDEFSHYYHHSNNDRYIYRDCGDMRSYCASTGPVNGIVNNTLRTLPNNSDQGDFVNRKSQDGVGSFESWNYVFKNLERSGYTKNLGERDDLLMQSLDLNSLHLTPDYTSLSCVSVDSKQSIDQKHCHNENCTNDKEINHEADKSIKMPIITGHMQRGQLTSLADIKKTKVELQLVNNFKNSNISLDKKTTVTTLMTTTRPITSTSKHDSKLTEHNKHQMNNYENNANNNNNGNESQAGIMIRRDNKNINNKYSNNYKTVINEWNCRFCTFLNPNTKRICEMCCHSKDFNLERSKTLATNTPTCV